MIVAVQDAETVAALDAMNAKVMGNASAHPYYGAPTILLVWRRKRTRQGELDCSAIGGNLLNAAYAVGLGSCWIHRSKEMFESEEGKALLKKWGLPKPCGAFARLRSAMPTARTRTPRPGNPATSSKSDPPKPEPKHRKKETAAISAAVSFFCLIRKERRGILCDRLDIRGNMVYHSTNITSTAVQYFPGSRGSRANRAQARPGIASALKNFPLKSVPYPWEIWLKR